MRRSIKVSHNETWQSWSPVTFAFMLLATIAPASAYTAVITHHGVPL